MSAAGTYARIPMGEAFDVMCVELEDILNRVCGIEEVALAYAWMNKHSMKVPDREALAKGAGDGCHAGAAPFASAGRLGDGVAVGQAAGSSSAPTKRELERAALSPSLCVECGESMYGETTTLNGRPRHIKCPREFRELGIPYPYPLVGEPPSPSGRENPEAASLGTGESRKHGGGSPTRHLAAVPREAS